jgi:hypothetical protein
MRRSTVVQVCSSVIFLRNPSASHWRHVLGFRVPCSFKQSCQCFQIVVALHIEVCQLLM